MVMIKTYTHEDKMGGDEWEVDEMRINQNVKPSTISVKPADIHDVGK